MKLVPLLLALSLVGCGLDSGPGPDLPRGAYGLASVDGNALPFTMRDDDEVGRWVLLADTIFVLGGGRAERRRITEVTGSTFQADTVMIFHGETNYRFVNGELQVGFIDCPINALCTSHATGEIVPDGFRLQVGLITFSGVGLFLRAQ